MSFRVDPFRVAPVQRHDSTRGSSGRHATFLPCKQQVKGSSPLPGSTNCRAELWAGLYLRGQGTDDLREPQQKRSFVEPLPTEPAADFGVALACIARPAGRHHVGERVPPSSRYRQDAVALKWEIGGARSRRTHPRPASRRTTGRRSDHVRRVRADADDAARTSPAGHQPRSHRRRRRSEQLDSQRREHLVGDCARAGYSGSDVSRMGHFIC